MGLLKDVLIVFAADGHYVVTPVWDGVDRPIVGGTSTGKNLKLAQRLKAAFLAGAAYDSARVCVDCNGKTYISTRQKFLGRMLNADLKRMGF